MKRKEAVAIAESWVRERYPAVPPIADAFEILADNMITDGLAVDAKQAVRQNQGNWMVFFFCSWDTDELGMPSTLIVIVDQKTQEARLES